MTNTIATKPYSSNPQDSYLTVVLHQNFKGEYVTHIHNSYDDGYHYGRYFESLEDAMKDFQSRGMA
jgi:hypothetical protein